MPSRKYYLVGDRAVDNTMKPKLQRDKIRNVSISNSADLSDTGSSVKSGFICEVRKSPRAPEYEVHYIKTKKDGLKEIRTPVAPRPKKKQGLLKGRAARKRGEITGSEDESLVNSDISAGKTKGDMVGLRVIACNKHDGLYYPGHVANNIEAVYAMVKFKFNEKRQRVRTQMIIPMSGAIPRPELQPGDYVLVKVINGGQNAECYVPAIIEFIPENDRHSAKFYSVLLYNGQRATTMRQYVVKIGRSRFDLALKYISHIQQQNTLRAEKDASSSKGRKSGGHHSDVSEHTYDGASTDRSNRSSDRSSHKSTDRSSRRSSDRSSKRSGDRPRRKKEKYTKKIADKTKGHHKKRRRSRSSSSSKSSSSSRSHSKSSRSHSSRSRSPASSRSRGRSRSRSRSSSRSRTNSPYSARMSQNSYRSSFDSRSNSSRSRSRSSERPGSRARSKSRLQSRSSSRSSSRSKSTKCDNDSFYSDGSSTPRARRSPVERPSNPVPKPRPLEPLPRNDSLVGQGVTRQDIYSTESRYSIGDSRYSAGDSRLANVDEKDQVIGELQYQLEKQTRKQLRQERRLVRQARKINKIQRKLKTNDYSGHTSGHSSHNDSMQSVSERSVKREEMVQKSWSEETDTSPQRGRKGSPDGTSYIESPDILGARQQLNALRVDQEVLARWSDDGWYYRGRVEADKGDNQYIVRDAAGQLEVIVRDDIIVDVEHRFDVIQPQDYVIALHSKYVFSFAPAEVLDTYGNDSCKVELFDGCVTKLTNTDVYKVSKAKYKKVVEYIKEHERRLVGKSVVARDDDTGVYRLGLVDAFVNHGQQYFIKWLNGQLCKQTAQHMFEVSHRPSDHTGWEYVLAPVDERNTRYMPAQITQSNPLLVQFCNGDWSRNVSIDQCFMLSEIYYRNAREYIMANTPEH